LPTHKTGISPAIEINLPEKTRRRHPGAKRRARVDSKDGCHCEKIGRAECRKACKCCKAFPVESCSVCASPLHQAQNCPSMTAFEMEQVNAFNNFQKPSSGPYSKTYNPGWRNHPNFSWKQNQPTTNQGRAPHYPPGFSSYQNQGRSAPPASSSSYQQPTQAPASST
jgi:hypothetical protein